LHGAFEAADINPGENVSPAGAQLRFQIHYHSKASNSKESISATALASA